MDNLKSKKILFIAVTIIGTSPLACLYIYDELRIRTFLGGMIPALDAALRILILAGSVYVHLYCLRRMTVVGYSKYDSFRLFIPIYGIYFAYSISVKILSGKVEVQPQSKQKLGRSF